MEIVHDKPEGAPFINIEGKKGESLFYRPLIWGIEKDMKLISGQYAEYERLVREAKEERLLALIGAMSMEEALDFFLRAYIPDYSRLEENRDFSLSMKIDLAYSLRLIPTHILNTADLVRGIRNRFAHDLSIDCFDSLDDSFKNKLRVKFKELFPDDTNAGPAFADMFVKVVDGVIIGLEIYASNLKNAREYIYSEDFLKKLINVLRTS